MTFHKCSTSLDPIPDGQRAFWRLSICRSGDSREPPVAAGGLAAVPRERAVEGVLGRVANLARDCLDRFGGVLQPLRREMHAPAREVGQRWLAHDLREAPCECRAGDVYLACERLDRPWLGRPRVKICTWDDLLTAAEAVALHSEA